MNKPEQKFTRLTFDVTYWKDDGTVKEVVKVRPPNLDKLHEPIVLLEDLIRVFIDCDGSLGRTLATEAAISHMRSLAKLMPIVGKKEAGIDIDNLLEAGDIVQIGKIFFSRTINPEMSEAVIINQKGEKEYIFPEHRSLPEPGEIARLLDIPFLHTVNQIARDNEKKKKKEKEAATQTQEEASNGKKSNPEEVVLEVLEAGK
jgi:hypothetical protein